MLMWRQISYPIQGKQSFFSCDADSSMNNTSVVSPKLTSLSFINCVRDTVTTDNQYTPNNFVQPVDFVQQIHTLK